MAQVYSLADFGGPCLLRPSTSPSYWYTGQCPTTGVELRLPRTAQVEAIAQVLMQQLAADPLHPPEGKMYGVLLVEGPTGELGILKAFSGLLNGQAERPGWVPPIPGKAQIEIAEIQTLQKLEQLKYELVALQALPERVEYAQLAQDYRDQLTQLADTHRQRKQQRDRQRTTYQTQLSGTALATALAALIVQSQQDGLERRHLKQQRDAVLQPLKTVVTQADQQIHRLKQRRKALSRQLQTQMHTAYSLTNFAGLSATLHDLMPTGLPTGTGACAAPKLLHYAATHQFKPLALAEFWWGYPSNDKRPGEFYGACLERCQPIMGFLLSGLPPQPSPSLPLSLPIPILYQDDALIVVDKPTGLLSVPGRTRALQDSVLSRLRCQLTEYPFLQAVHRLDKGTSGVFVIATSPESHRIISRQFAERQIHKHYEAILSRPVDAVAGTIDLPLWRNPRDRPKQSVDYKRGKPSITTFRITSQQATPRVDLVPLTGRTHQLRVHAAHCRGLNSPILGDGLYGCHSNPGRLYLHATALELRHPLAWKPMKFSTPAPF